MASDRCFVFGFLSRLWFRSWSTTWLTICCLISNRCPIACWVEGLSLGNKRLIFFTTSGVRTVLVLFLFGRCSFSVFSVFFFKFSFQCWLIADIFTSWFDFKSSFLITKAYIPWSFKAKIRPLTADDNGGDMVTAVNVKTKAQHIEERLFWCGKQPIKITITGKRVRSIKLCCE